MRPIDNVLPKFDMVRPNGAGKWIARCSAHGPDRTPSLSIKECEDGTVLLKCWAGCSAVEITAAIGLGLRDLFPGDKPVRLGPSKAAVRHELAVYEIGVAMQKQDWKLSEEDQARFELAKQRLGVANDSAK